MPIAICYAHKQCWASHLERNQQVAVTKTSAAWLCWSVSSLARLGTSPLLSPDFHGKILSDNGPWSSVFSYLQQDPGKQDFGVLLSAWIRMTRAWTVNASEFGKAQQNPSAWGLKTSLSLLRATDVSLWKWIILHLSTAGSKYCSLKHHNAPRCLCVRQDSRLSGSARVCLQAECQGAIVGSSLKRAPGGLLGRNGLWLLLYLRTPEDHRQFTV